MDVGSEFSLVELVVLRVNTWLRKVPADPQVCLKGFEKLTNIALFSFREDAGDSSPQIILCSASGWRILVTCCSLAMTSTLPLKCCHVHIGGGFHARCGLAHLPGQAARTLLSLHYKL